MVMDLRDIANPFGAAKVLGVDSDPSAYHRSNGERGTPDFIMSRSELMEFHHCPSRWVKGFVSKESSATQYGTLMDCLLLQEGLFEKRFAVEPETYISSNGEAKPWTYQANACKDWREEKLANGLTPVSPEDVAEAREALAVLRADETIAALADESDTQVFVLAEYHDDDTGLVIPVKALIDLVPPVDGPFGKTLMDFKTAASAAPGPWKRAVYEHGYHVQAALYLDAYTAATGDDRVDWMFLIQENYRPWETGKRFLTAEFINLGRQKYVDALKRYARCLKDGIWPTYDSESHGELTYRGFNSVSPEIWMIQ